MFLEDGSVKARASRRSEPAKRYGSRSSARWLRMMLADDGAAVLTAALHLAGVTTLW